MRLFAAFSSSQWAGLDAEALAPGGTSVAVIAVTGEVGRGACAGGEAGPDPRDREGVVGW
nr:unnamed protein product [Digitaria exilis]